MRTAPVISAVAVALAVRLGRAQSDPVRKWEIAADAWFELLSLCERDAGLALAVVDEVVGE